MATTAPIILPIKTPGLNQLQKLEMKMKALEKTVEQLNADLVKNATATKAAGRAAATATGNIQRMGIAIRTTLGPIVGLYGAVNFLNKALQVASDRQVNLAKLTNGLKNLGATQADLEDLIDAADRFGKSTLFDQEDATNAFALLTSFQRIGVESYERVTQAASDLATVTGQDLKSAQIQLAKALEDPTKRVTDLARSGTVFTDQQKEQIKTLQESGRLFEAQNLILKEIEKQYGGAAEAAGSAGLAGALDSLGEETRDFQEKLVEATRAIEIAEGAINLLTQQIAEADGTLSELSLVVQYFSENTDGAATFVGQLVTQLGNLNNMALQVLPVFGDLARLMSFIANKQQEVNMSGPRVPDFGNNYASEERKLFQMTGGFLPTREKDKPRDLPKVPTGGGGGGAGGADAAAKAAEREAERVAKTLRDREQLVARLEQQIKIQESITGLGKEEQKLQLDVLEINQQYDNLLLKETNELIRQNTERARALELDLARQKAQESMMSAAQDDFTGFLKKQPEYQGLFNDELTETEKLLKGSYEIITNSLTSGIKGLIDGTKEWGDILSDIAGQLGSMFLNAGFSALGSGLGIPTGFAEGGFVDKPTQAMIGEAGEPEYAIPASKMSSAMQRYSQGMRGEAVTAGAGEYGDGSGGGTGEGNGAAPASHFTLDTVVINSVEYATVEQVRQMGATATANGARAGEARALGRLRTSVGARRKLGMS